MDLIDFYSYQDTYGCESLQQSLDSSRPSAPILRRPTKGAETDLVATYVESSLYPPKKGERLTTFIEPKVEGAYPDVVAVYWRPDIAEQWPSDRRSLGHKDIVAAHYLFMHRKTSIAAVIARFGKKQAMASIDKLRAAELVSLDGERISFCRDRRNFAVTRIVAIEAKMAASRKCLEQAVRNTWFASESYMLSDVSSPNEDMLLMAKQLGIGIVSSGTLLNRAAIKARREKIPKSYASWLFNEWVWREK